MQLGRQHWKSKCTNLLDSRNVFFHSSEFYNQVISAFEIMLRWYLQGCQVPQILYSCTQDFLCCLMVPNRRSGMSHLSTCISFLFSTFSFCQSPVFISSSYISVMSSPHPISSLSSSHFLPSYTFTPTSPFLIPWCPSLLCSASFGPTCFWINHIISISPRGKSPTLLLTSSGINAGEGYEILRMDSQATWRRYRGRSKCILYIRFLQPG